MTKKVVAKDAAALGTGDERLPLPPAPTHPGNRGKGNLRIGNPGNRGRAASLVRQQVLGDAPGAHKFLKQVMSGKPVIEAQSYCNTCDETTDGKLAAPLTERITAAREILRYGLGPAGTSTEIELLQSRVRAVLNKQLTTLDTLLATQPDLHREVMLQLSGLWAELQ